MSLIGAFPYSIWVKVITGQETPVGDDRLLLLVTSSVNNLSNVTDMAQSIAVPNHSRVQSATMIIYALFRPNYLYILIIIYIYWLLSTYTDYYQHILIIIYIYWLLSTYTDYYLHILIIIYIYWLLSTYTDLSMN